MASAQCNLVQHPSSARYFKVSLVQAFVSCGNPGGNTVNAMTEGGVSSCQPVQTFNDKNGGEPSGWRWDPLYSYGLVEFKPMPQPACLQVGTSLPPGCPGGLNPIGDTIDLRAKLKLRGIIATDSPLGATGTGTMATVARATLDDRMFGFMTVIDFPAGFPFTLVNGKATMKTSADALLNSILQPGLPPCTTIDVVGIHVLDENGNNFGNLGSYMP
jgi:hypothetical protein